jgi:uncharacterized protein
MNVAIRVQPRAKRNALVRLPDGKWKLFLNAPAVEGKANQALVEFLAKGLGIARSRVRVLSGEKSRQKVVSLDGVNEDQFSSLAGPKSG